MEKTRFGKILILLAIVVFVGLQFSLWLGEGGVRDVQQLKRALAAQKDENRKLAERNRVLQAEVDDLKEGMEAIEEHARQDLGMIKNNETFFLVTGSPDSSPPAPKPPASR